ncbi:MAG: hypothetical protein R3B46_09580 [Phycisphaerales bacterium]
MIATNNTPGHDRIGFAIPQREWQLQFLFPGRAVVKAINTPSGASDSVTIDGTSQTAFTGDTNPDGWEVAFYGGGVYVNGDDSEVTGIDSLPLDVTGDNAAHSWHERNDKHHPLRQPRLGGARQHRGHDRKSIDPIM